MELPNYEKLTLYGEPIDTVRFVHLTELIWKITGGDKNNIVFAYVEKPGLLSALLPVLTQTFERGRSVGFYIEGDAFEALVSVGHRKTGPSGHDILNVTVSISVGSEINQSLMLLREIGELVNAHFGWYSPQPSELLIESKLIGCESEPTYVGLFDGYPTLLADDRFPRLSVFNYTKWMDVRVPYKLGWANYWSANTCQLLNFPRPRDEELLKTSRQLDSGAWLVRLTEDPLDVSKKEHIDIVVSAYQRFSKINNR